MLAGVSGGIVGGLAFGLIMVGQVISRVSALNDLGLLPRLIDAANDMAVWGVHLAVSALFGLIYALLVSTRSVRANAFLGIGYGIAIFIASSLVIGMARGASLFSVDVTALAGHVVFGIALGLVYPMMWREELKVVAKNAAERAHGR